MVSKMSRNIVGGYVGVYNGNILKSSYEYIFAKILEHDGVVYKVEEETFWLDKLGVRYTPDFFLYDFDNKLYEIIEIRGHRFGIEERIVSTDLLREQMDNNISVKLYTEIDLRKMCSDRGMSYNNLKMQWRTDPNNIKGCERGIVNPMYGVKMSDKTKSLIKQKAIERAEKDPDKYRKLGEGVAQWCKERNYDHLRGERVPRYTLTCEVCGKQFSVIQGSKDIRKCCSIKCSSKKGALIASEGSIRRRVERDKQLSEFILSWAVDNHDTIIEATFNCITPTLNAMLNAVEEEFGIVDLRTISKAFDTGSRKKLLSILKDHVLSH